MRRVRNCNKVDVAQLALQQLLCCKTTEALFASEFFYFVFNIFCNIDNVVRGLLQQWWCRGIIIFYLHLFCNIDVVAGGLLPRE